MDGRLRPSDRDERRLEAFLPSPVIQNHAANLMVLGNGQLACVWFGGTMEGLGDISIYFSRLEDEDTRWSEPERLSDDALRSEQNPVLFPVPDGRLWLLYTSQPSGHQDQAVVKCRISEDDGRSFGPVGMLCDVPGTFVRQPLFVNAQGDWLLPVFECRTPPGQLWRGDDDTSAVLISRDTGKSWASHSVPDSTGAVHMNIIAGHDGELLAFFRSRYADAVKISRSTDGGRTWSPPADTALPNNNSSIQAIRLADGGIGLIYNASSAATSSARRASLYDEIGGGTAADAPSSSRPAVWGVPRAPLVLAVSDDQGQSFPLRRTLEVGTGYCLSNNSRDGLNRELSYPSIRQTADGAIHLAFTYHRRAIKHVRLAPGWLRTADA
ncbi:MAG: exo-alpha-sialidase [Devosia sp.]|nr:exo-alpha-sialidase [Devosia sp.]